MARLRSGTLTTTTNKLNRFERPKLPRITNRDRFRWARFSDARFISAARILTWWRRWRQKLLSGPLSNGHSTHSETDIGNTMIDVLADRVQEIYSTMVRCITHL